MNSNFKENFNFITNILLFFILVFGTIVYADTNGVWHKAEDVQGGIFGLDEQDVSAVLGFRFINKVIFSSDVYLNTSNCNKISTDNTGKMICNNTVDSIGLKNVQCPSGKAVVGFDINGAIICNGFQMAAPINCAGSFNTCSASCNGGTQTYSITTNAENGGVACPYANGYVQACNTGACAVPVNCVGSFNTCNAACGRGTQTYSITTPEANGGAQCSYSNGQTQECNSQLCLVIWTRSSDSSGTAYDVAVDVSGNVYTTGYYSTGSNEYINTLKYDSNGIKLWNKNYAPSTSTGGYGNRAWGIAVDPSGNVYVTGNSYQGGKDVIYTVKYDTNGNIVWSKIYNTGTSSIGFDITLDSSGNVYVTGRAQNAGTTNAIVIKYNNAGTQQWAKFLSTSSTYSEAVAIAVDSSGNSYITGGINSNLFVAKFDSSGTESWKVTNTGGYYGRDIALDSSGRVYIVGASNPWNDILLRYDSSGNPVIFSGYGAYIIPGYLKGGYTNSIGEGITIDGADNIYITGRGMDGGGMYKAGSIAKFSSSGSPVWQRSDISTDIYGITKDSNNKLYISGSASGNYYISKYDNYPFLPN